MEDLDAMWMIARVHRSLDWLKGNSWNCQCRICIRSRNVIAQYIELLTEIEDAEPTLTEAEVRAMDKKLRSDKIN